MDYMLNEQQIKIQQSAKKIADELIKPKRQEYDEKAVFPWDVVKAMAEADLYKINIEEKYGGLGLGVFDASLAVEQLCRACGGIGLGLAATGLGTYPIVLLGNDEQKERYLPDLASGAKLAAFALTEPNAGSDASSIEAVAKKDGDYYICNGTKQWITNGAEAEVYTVAFKTNPSKGGRGISMFVIDKGTPGFSFGKKENKLGIRASATCSLIFEDCKIPKENLIGREGSGFLNAMKTFDHARPGVAAQALGIAQGALDEALLYATKKEMFGKILVGNQSIQFMLADMATQIEAARSLIYSVGKAIDKSGGSGSQYSKESAMAKLYASDVAMKVATDAVQIMGSDGYLVDYPAEKIMRDAKITQIYEGTNQIQRLVIARSLIKELAKGAI